METVYFRVDASVQIGIGHVMRCLTLADALASRGITSSFICRPQSGDAIELIKCRGHKVHPLPKLVSNSFNGVGFECWLGIDWQEDAAQTFEILEVNQPDWLVVDHYGIDQRWEILATPKGTKILAVDDLANRSHMVDILLDQNLGREKEHYRELASDSRRFLLGPDFALLRPEFLQHRPESLLRRKVKRENLNILVSMGGIDLPDLTSSVLKSIGTIGLAAGTEIVVVMGGAAPALSQVEELALALPLICKVLVDVKNMAELMQTADISIGTSGSTSWERCCLGLPSIVFIGAENQREIGRNLEILGAVLLCSLDNMPAFTKTLHFLSTSKPELLKISKKASRLCDGKGATRVVASLLSFDISIQESTKEDAKDVWKWRHEGEASRFYSNPEITPWPIHKKWYEQAVSDPNHVLLMCVSENEAVAHVRFDLLEKSASVSICLALRHRGKGLGAPCVIKACSWAFENFNLESVEAVVHHQNTTSRGTFLNSGFALDETRGDFQVFRLGSDGFPRIRQQSVH